MGCGSSKVDDLPLVKRCRARKEMIKSAMDYRYDLSSSHVAYFRSLNDIGYALSRFVDEELVVSSSSASSPVLTLPSDEGSKTDSSISYIHSIDRNNDSHLQLSSDSESDLHSSSGGHIHIHDDDDDDSVPGNNSKSSLSSFYPPYNHNHNQTNWNDVDPYRRNLAPSPYPFPNGPSYESAWAPYGGIFYSYSGNSNMYYMKKSAPARNTVFHKEERGFQSDYNSNVDAKGGFSGFTKHNPTEAPSPPPPPKASDWDFLNLFEGYENGYPSYGYGYGYSSPDTSEVREREGIPDLEEETENESHSEEVKLDTTRNKREDTTRFVPKENIQVNSSQSSGGSSKRVPKPSRNSEGTSDSVPSHSIDIEVDTSIRSTVSESVGEKKEASVEADEEVESSRLSSLKRLSPHGSLGLEEVFNEIKNEFNIAFGYGKEVDMLLESGKVPYHPKFALLKVALSMIMYPFSSSLSPKQSQLSRSQTTKLARSYHLDAVASISLSSTLEKLYTWEKKLYKQVKDEERLRLKYDKMSKKLKDLDARGAEYTKIDAVRASVRRTLTKLDVCIKSIDAISSKIQKVRDEELQPQLSELIYGFVRMWKLIVKCHRKQFQVVSSSKTWNLKANISPRSDNATIELIIVVLSWCKHFEDWINAQKSFVNSLNAWLQECIDHESEVTNIPFSPGRIGAPPIFMICNDWYNGVKRVSEEHVSTAIRVFASNLRKLLERREDELNQRLKTEQLAKDFSEKRQNLRIDALERGFLEADDRKMELRLLRKKTEEARRRHKEAVKLVHDAASSCLKGGLIPVFKALQDFSCDALKAHEQIRLK
ncbi:unnamed protein product [Lactuca virosa]|uniref:DUF632 domain-containing protein n=1 Tax=Lactuca virosa TaxID=75947 RepID=A0AAU9NZ58_9ASTR|nr:unnamed protein product [Lactuca virosa]